MTTDSYYADLRIANDLLTNKHTIVGISRQNRKFLLSCFTVKKSRDPYNSQFGFHDKVTLVTYQAKTKQVTLLSSMHTDKAVEDNTKNKLEIVTFYNSSEGGIDTMD